MKIVRLRDEKIITKEELAFDLHSAGVHIVPTEIECIAKDIETKLDSNYFLII